MSPRIQYLLLPLMFTAVACGEMPQELSTTETDAQLSSDIFVPSNVNCNPESLNGFYETLTIRRSGDCPSIDPFILRMSDGQMSWGNNCQTESVAFSEKSCQQDTLIICETGDQQIVIDARLAQLEEAGSILTGTMTIQFKTGSEESSVACISEYQTKLERF